jgi:deoxyribodipyrimidine photo-lyase
MRAMCASVFGLLLKQPWQVGADFMYYHLVDADPAINYTQWQSQCGLKGIGAIRLYNPRKQVRDNDPEGVFVRRWVPELEAVPTAHLDRPERTPLAVQEEVGVRIGEDYPYPVVDYEAEREAALETFGGLREAARAAYEDPEVFRRASLSPRSRTRATQAGSASAADGDGTGGADRSDRQTGLDRFS